MNSKIEKHIGGAGTGKTRLILSKLSEAKEDLSLSVEQICMTTFTRAGRQEISERASREWDCEIEQLTKAGWFRTAHSIACRQCGLEADQLLEGAKGAEWIGNVLGAKMATRFDSRSREVVYVSGDGDDTLTMSLKAWDLARSRMVPVSSVLRLWAQAGEYVPDESAVIHYAERYESAKRREGRYDYTDMIARFSGVRFSPRNGPEEIDPEGEVPAEIRVLAIDEAQDSSVLIDRICRRLAGADHVERVFICGDPYQSIFGFGGGDFRHFLAWEAREFTMPQSYRCPPKIMEYGERCLRKMHSGYRDRGITPASHDGSVRRVGSAQSAIAGIDLSVSTLILGRCGFALAGYEEILKGKGIPYSWIDRIGSAAQMSGYSCLWNLQHGEVVHGEDLANAIAMIPTEVKSDGKFLTRGAKAAWKDGRKSHLDLVRPVSEDYTLAGITEKFAGYIADGTWPLHLEGRVADKAVMWHKSALYHGPEIASRPRVRLSTIHSAKGCEADHVILSTQSSPAVERGRTSVSQLHDEECRVNYVGVTRARHNLSIVEDGSKCRLELPA